MKETNAEIVLFETADKSVSLPVEMKNETVWLSANQMSLLFERDEKTIRKHINNVFSEGELEKENNAQKMRVVGVKQSVPFYSLDVIISVGYRVKSNRGVEFRRWANSVLRQYILQGYAVNQNHSASNIVATEFLLLLYVCPLCSTSLLVKFHAMAEVVVPNA